METDRDAATTALGAPLPLQPLEAQVVAGWYNLEAVVQVMQDLEMQRNVNYRSEGLHSLSPGTTSMLSAVVQLPAWSDYGGVLGRSGGRRHSNLLIREELRKYFHTNQLPTAG